jgi:fibronectin type 3 domain-containing protein
VKLISQLGLLGLQVCLLAMLSQPAWSQNACDLDRNGTVNDADVALAKSMTLGSVPCSTVIGDGTCDIVMIQRVINARIGLGCVPHTASLSWTASVSANVTGYNVYRGATAGGPYTKLNSALVAGTTYTDTTVQAGQTYYYVATAVDSGGNESAYSNEARAVVPSPPSS